MVIGAVVSAVACFVVLPTLDRRPARRSDVDETEAGTAASSWIDVAKTVAAYCKAQGRPIPEEIEETVVVHIETIEQWISELGKRNLDSRVPVSKTHGKAPPASPV